MQTTSNLTPLPDTILATINQLVRRRMDENKQHSPMERFSDHEVLTSKTFGIEMTDPSSGERKVISILEQNNGEAYIVCDQASHHYYGWFDAHDTKRLGWHSVSKSGVREEVNA